MVGTKSEAEGDDIRCERGVVGILVDRVERPPMAIMGDVTAVKMKGGILDLVCAEVDPFV